MPKSQKSYEKKLSKVHIELTPQEREIQHAASEILKKYDDEILYDKRLISRSFRKVLPAELTISQETTDQEEQSIATNEEIDIIKKNRLLNNRIISQASKEVEKILMAMTNIEKREAFNKLGLMSDLHLLEPSEVESVDTIVQRELLDALNREYISNDHSFETETKPTLKLDENDILKISEKIQKNALEDQRYAKSLEEYLSNNGKTTEPLIVGSTPISLEISGANPDLNVVITPRTIAKCMAEANEKYHGHGLSEEIMKQLPSELRNPTMIFKGNKDNSLVVITQLKDKENRDIMIAVSLSERKGFREVNRISSAYGRNNMNNYLKNQIQEGNLIACNKEKAERMLHSAGLQLPLENTFFSFDNSIAYSRENVKQATENFMQNTKSEAATYKLLPFLNFKYHSHIEQINNFNEKKSACFDKIAYRHNKINKLNAKVDRITQTNKMLKSMFEGTRFFGAVNSYISRNEDKINQIKKERISKHQAKIEVQNKKIERLNHKIEVKQCKADKLAGLSNIIKSFITISPTKRLSMFIEGMRLLNSASKRSLQFKLDKCDTRIDKLNEKYKSVESTVTKLDISNQLTDLHSRRNKLSDKLEKIKHSVSLSKQDPDKVEKLIEKTESDINKAIQSENVNISDLADDICISTADYLHEAEMDIEGNVVNEKAENKTEIENAEPEKEQTGHQQDKGKVDKINPEYYKSLSAKDRHTRKMSDSVADRVIDQLKEQDIMVSGVRYANNITGLTVHVKDSKPFDQAVSDSFKSRTDEKKSYGLVYNSEFYKSLPKENQFINEFPEKEAMQYINALKSEECNFSYKVKDGGRIAVTIDNRDDRAVSIYNQYLSDTLDNLYSDNRKFDLRNKGFTEDQIVNIDIFTDKFSELAEKDNAILTFSEHITPEYSLNQISQISSVVAEIYSQSESDRLQDTNGLYQKLSDMKSDFDIDVKAQGLFENHNYSDSQKDALKNALKSDVSTDVLSELDESFSESEINKFTEMYKTADFDRVDRFLKKHSVSGTEQSNTGIGSKKNQKKEFTLNRSRFKQQAQKLTSDKSTSHKDVKIENAI